MDGYRIRRGGFERSVADEATMRALAAAGELRGTDEIQTQRGWIRADQHPLLGGMLRGGDPWSAWSDVESVDAASLYKKMVDTPLPDDGELTELPFDALSPMVEINRPVHPAPAAAHAHAPPAASEAARPISAPANGLSEFDLLAMRTGSGAEVIDFPRTRPAVPEVRLPARPSARRPAPPPLVRPARLVGMIVAGLGLLALGYGWIRVSAYSGEGAGTRAARTTTARTAVTEPAVSPLVELDADLRSLLAAHPRDVKEAGDFSDALLVELVQLRVEVIEANGLVTKWIGKKGDEPKSAEVRVSYRSAGDMSRELGAIALVVGRYKRFFRMDMPVFEVTEVGARGVTRIDANQAEAYYQARITLEELLTSLTAPPVDR